MRKLFPLLPMLAGCLLSAPAPAQAPAASASQSASQMVAVDPATAPLTLAVGGALPQRWSRVERGAIIGNNSGTIWTGLLDYSGYLGKIVIWQMNVPNASWTNNTARSMIGMWREMVSNRPTILEGSGGSLTHGDMLVNYIYFRLLGSAGNTPAATCFNFFGQAGPNAMSGYVCSPGDLHKAQIATQFIKAVGFKGLLTPTSFAAPTIQGAPTGPSPSAARSGPAPAPTPEPTGNQGAAGPLARAALSQRLDRASVMVLGFENDRLSGLGSGFFVSRNRIVTNAHVARAARTLKITSRHIGRLVEAQVLVAEPNFSVNGDDFAVLAVEGVDGTPLPLAHTADKLQEVITAGYPSLTISNDSGFAAFLSSKGQSAVPDLVVSRGEINSIQLNTRNRRELLHSAQTGPGNSGGPLVDICGRALGVSVKTIVQGGGVGGRTNVAIGSLELHRWLKGNGVTVGLAAGRCG